VSAWFGGVVGWLVGMKRVTRKVVEQVGGTLARVVGCYEVRIGMKIRWISFIMEEGKVVEVSVWLVSEKRGTVALVCKVVVRKSAKYLGTFHHQAVRLKVWIGRSGLGGQSAKFTDERISLF
jgi:hypothetical protein